MKPNTKWIYQTWKGDRLVFRCWHDRDETRKTLLIDNNATTSMCDLPYTINADTC